MLEVSRQVGIVVGDASGGGPLMAKGRPREFDTEKALDAALLLFWRYGYEGTSMSALTTAMRISTPSLYAAFGSKEALFRKAVDRYVQRPASYLPNALKEPTARRAVEKVFRGAINMVMHPRHPDGCLLVHGALAVSPAYASIRTQLSLRRAAAEAAVRGRFDQAIADGDLPARVNARKLARYIVTVLWGLSVQAAGGAKRSELHDVARLALQCWPRPFPTKP
jgi:AcrR family transcriptional regulator